MSMKRNLSARGLASYAVNSMKQRYENKKLTSIVKKTEMPPFGFYPESRVFLRPIFLYLILA